MSLIDDVKVDEVYRDRYARESILSNGVVNISCPCHGIGIRTKKDLEIFMKLRLTHPTEKLGLCIVSLENVDDTFIDIKKRLEEEQYKLAPTAEGKQLKMFQEQTFLAVEPSTECTYYYNKDVGKNMLSSLETPNFLKEMIKDIKRERAKYDSGSAEEFQEWKSNYFEETWLGLNADSQLLNELVNENFESQNRCLANIQIPPTPPLVKPSLFYVAIKIIEAATKKAKKNTAIYFNMPFAILKNEDLREKILTYCEKSPNKIIIMKIHDLDNLLNPDKEDEREAFSQIQDKMCDLRREGKLTILLEGEKLTFPSLVRGFDVVTNHISGRNKRGGRRNKERRPNELTGYSQYFIKEKQIFYQFPKMITFAENQLKITNDEHGLTCALSCCKDIKSLNDITRDIWNYSVTRPHYCLTMNEMVKKISSLINGDKIHKAKDILLLSELCVLKHLIPDT